MTKANVYYDSDSGYLGGESMHPETWRVHGNEAQMIDVSEHGPLSPATDDGGVNTCEKPSKRNVPNSPYAANASNAADAPNARSAADAPYFKGEGAACVSGSLSGASDGAAASKRSAERLAEHARDAGPDIEDPDGIGRRIV